MIIGERGFLPARRSASPAGRYDSDLGRFLSTDPLAKKYAMWSPYHYVYNSPLLHIDPTGADIIIVNRKIRALQNLAKIVSNPYGQRTVNRLMSSPHKYRVKIVNTTYGSAYDWNGEIGTPRTIYAVGSSWMPSLDGGEISGAYALFHEMDHAAAHDRGRIRMTDEVNLERSAVTETNRMRAAFGDDLRPKYSGLLDPITSRELRFSEDPSRYNHLDISISNFDFLEAIEGKNASVVGFSFDYKEGDARSSTRYGVTWTNNEGKVNYKIFTSKDDYESFLGTARRLAE